MNVRCNGNAFERNKRLTNKEYAEAKTKAVHQNEARRYLNGHVFKAYCDQFPLVKNRIHKDLVGDTTITPRPKKQPKTYKNSPDNCSHWFRKKDAVTSKCKLCGTEVSSI